MRHIFTIPAGEVERLLATPTEKLSALEFAFLKALRAEYADDSLNKRAFAGGLETRLATKVEVAVSVQKI